MRKLTTADITDHREYEREREAFRAEIIAMKKRRRIPLGDVMTIVFENTATMRFQVQEMARAERMLSDEQIAHEVATYNELIPDPGELSATLFIEVTSAEGLPEWLPRLVGIQHHVVCLIGEAGDGVHAVRAYEPGEERLSREDRITASVHYLKFSFTPEEQALFATSPVRLVVDHPEYQVEVPLSDEQRAELASDFA